MEVKREYFLCSLNPFPEFIKIYDSILLVEEIIPNLAPEGIFNIENKSR